MKVVICSSAAFYEHVVSLKIQLQERDVTVVVPKTATVMEESGDFVVEHYKTWFENDDDYVKKGELMRAHFDEISAGDAILVVNDAKHGIAGYIGPNVLMEMCLAWYQNKPIYVLYDLPENTAFEEELKGMQPIVLHGELERLIHDAQQ